MATLVIIMATGLRCIIPAAVTQRILLFTSLYLHCIAVDRFLCILMRLNPRATCWHQHVRPITSTVLLHSSNTGLLAVAG